MDMSANAVIAIDIEGPVLRYAEIQPQGDRRRLLRLGSCDFEFDVARETLDESHRPAHLNSVAEALGDAFQGTTAEVLNLSIHPMDGLAFSTMVAADVDDGERDGRLRQQAALLTGSAPGTLHIVAETVRTAVLDDEPIEWVHVLAVPRPIQERFQALTKRLPGNDVRWHLSTKGASHVASYAQKAQTSDQDQSPVTLAIGQYEGYTEYGLSHGQTWFHSYYEQATTPEDRIYFMVSMMKRLRLSPEAIGHVFVYGEDVALEDYAMVRSVLDAEVHVLNPLDVIEFEQEGLSGEAGLEVYTPVIGVLL